MGGVATVAIQLVSAIPAITSLFKSKSGGQPNVGVAGQNTPTVTPFQVPADQQTALNQAVTRSNQLSQQASAVAQQALEQYKSGALSDAYASQYQQQYNEQLQQVKASLASAGFTEGSTQYQSAMQQFEQSMGALKGQYLQKQLNDAVTSSGLSQNEQAQVINVVNTESGAVNGSNSTILDAAHVNSEINSANAQTNKGIGDALGKLATNVGGLFPNKDPNKTAPAATPANNVGGLKSSSTGANIPISALQGDNYA